ncbi:MAG: helix-turn-helix transcriptional regulator [Bacteroidales bacterium]|nr:helix-turn-helix transcriptional regulator [Bacteroidales bacterium]
MKNHPLITSSEEKILLLIKVGLTNNSIANVLGKSPNTIKYHLKKIYRKLGAGNKIEAINKYNEQIQTKR